VIRPGRPDMLAAAVMELKAHDDLRLAMGRKGLDYAHNRLSRAAAMLALDEIVDGVLAGTPARRILTLP